MKATIVDLRYRMKNILKALERNEIVQVFYRGREKARLISSLTVPKKRSLQSLPFFGLWKDRKDLKDVSGYVRKLREPRPHDV